MHIYQLLTLTNAPKTHFLYSQPLHQIKQDSERCHNVLRLGTHAARI